MVLEDLFTARRIRQRPHMAFIFGFALTFLGFLMALFFFRSSISVAMVLLTTLLLVPSVAMMLRMEEKIDSEQGLKHFFRNHKDIFEVYLFAFLGVFLAFVVIGIGLYGNPDMYGKVFGFQSSFLSEEQGLTSEVVHGFVDGNSLPGVSEAISLFGHDLSVVMICFVLSFFYGATAIFLVILNASIFANFIVFVIRTLGGSVMHGVQAFFFFLIHLLPEVAGFMVAAIAGGIVSKAVLHEKKGSTHFKNVFKDATVLLIIAMLLVLLSSMLEVFVTARLFQSFF